MELLYFILGLLFFNYVIPLLDGFSGWILTWLEAKKAKQGEIINDANIKMRQAATSADDVKHISGFYAPDENYEEEDDEDDL